MTSLRSPGPCNGCAETAASHTAERQRPHTGTALLAAVRRGQRDDAIPTSAGVPRTAGRCEKRPHVRGCLMNIWLAPSAFFPHRGGVEELTLQLAKQLSVRGHGVLVVTNQHPSSLDRHETVEGVEVHRLPFTAPSSRPRDAATFLWSQPSVQRSLDNCRRGRTSCTFNVPVFRRRPSSCTPSAIAFRLSLPAKVRW